MRKRVAAIIIKDKKILLVRDKAADFFSIPGGIIEEGEDSEIALSRELKEELNAKIKILNEYNSYNYIHTRLNVPQIDINYLVSLLGTPKASSEIAEIKWFTAEEIQSGKTKILFIFLEDLFPKLINDKLL